MNYYAAIEKELRALFCELEEPDDEVNIQTLNRHIYFDAIIPNKDTILAALESVPEWVKCEDRIPNLGATTEDCLVYGKTGFYSLLSLYDHYLPITATHDEVKADFMKHYTHWCSLPPAPKGGE